MIEPVSIPFPEDFERWKNSFSEKLKEIGGEFGIDTLSVNIVKDNETNELRLKEVLNATSIVADQVVAAFLTA